MEWLNYHHLLYFWTVAKTGTVTAASKELGLTPPTVSAQVHQLEEALGEQLFTKRGRHLVLTDMGKVVYGYADEIFGLGRELMDTLRGRPTGRPARLKVGISDVVPKLITHRILEPVLDLDPDVRLVCREGKTQHLLAELATHDLDVVLADEPIPSSVSVK
ncbi:MAG TPA: LysR family transcriptional regulator, partial [Polyangiaceae bacterium LLY-WYZ-15_(1-7)]|nr:LysR family transcriptional regulator [Polyangiaceae bacterium LLY-WYZ-15_(1-7)]